MARKKSHSRWINLRQLAEYSLSGGAYFWTGYLVFFICDKGFHWSLWWAKLASNVVGVTFNFLLERYWVFHRTGRKSASQEAPFRYILITLVDFVIDYWIIRGLKAAGLTPYIGQFVSAGFFWGWNWLWYKYWVFGGTINKSASRAKQSRKATTKRRKPTRK